jgi:hypothetical protein
VLSLLLSVQIGFTWEIFNSVVCLFVCGWITRSDFLDTQSLFGKSEFVERIFSFEWISESSCLQLVVFQEFSLEKAILQLYDGNCFWQSKYDHYMQIPRKTFAF